MTIQRGWGNEPLSKYPPGQNIPDLVVARGQAIVAREFRSDPRIPAEHRKHIPEGLGGVCVPLPASRKIIGAMFVNVHVPREITTGELRVLNALAEIGGNAIHRANLLEQTVKQLDRLAALRSIDIAISSSFDLKMTLNVVLDKVARELNVDATGILLLKPESISWNTLRGRVFGRGLLNPPPSPSGKVLPEEPRSKEKQSMLATFPEIPN